jgi:hypothetical protein
MVGCPSFLRVSYIHYAVISFPLLSMSQLLEEFFISRFSAPQQQREVLRSLASSCRACGTLSLYQLDRSNNGALQCILVKNAKEVCYSIEKWTWNQACLFLSWFVLIVAAENKLNPHQSH